MANAIRIFLLKVSSCISVPPFVGMQLSYSYFLEHAT
nr:MAG TPA: hypothetical protein [Bacteriophage sp.]